MEDGTNSSYYKIKLGKNIKPLFTSIQNIQKLYSTLNLKKCACVWVNTNLQLQSYQWKNPHHHSHIQYQSSLEYGPFSLVCHPAETGYKLILLILKINVSSKNIITLNKCCICHQFRFAKQLTYFSSSFAIAAGLFALFSSSSNWFGTSSFILLIYNRKCKNFLLSIHLH